VAVRKIASPTGKPKVLPPIHPNLGLQAAYRKRLDRLIDEMDRSLIFWLSAAYRKTPPQIAQDAPEGSNFISSPPTRSPARSLNSVVRRLARRWQRRFNEASGELAQYFATAAAERVDGTLKQILKKGGISVEFRMSREVNDIVQASVAQNVTLIKSIAQQHLAAVQGEVMRSVAAGRDLGSLAKALEHQHGVTRKRAAFIAHSQNNLATATITRARQQELGIDRAVWMHSHGGKIPRPTHVKMDGQPYDVSKGMWDEHEGKFVYPGELPRCRCVSRSVIPGF
jgi:uncharacterized protein with gpF-like domain